MLHFHFEGISLDGSKGDDNTSQDYYHLTVTACK